MICNAAAFIHRPSPSAQTRQRLAQAEANADRKLHGLWNESDGSRIGKPLSEVSPAADAAAAAGRPSSPSMDMPAPQPGRPDAVRAKPQKPGLHRGESSFLAQVSDERRNLRAKSTLTGDSCLAEGSRSQNRRRDFAYSSNHETDMHILAHFGLGSNSFVNTLYVTVSARVEPLERLPRQHGDPPASAGSRVLRVPDAHA